MDLQRIADDLKQLEQRLQRQAAPVRARLASLGVAGLYATAADELRLAEASPDPRTAALHRAAATAAEALGDHLL